MKRFSLWLIFALLLGSGAHAQGRAKVLFIGNSYTFVNDLPKMLQQLASADGLRIETVSDCPGGMTLEQHWKGAHARQSIEKSRFSWVVLQDQSQVPSFARSQLETGMYPAVRQLHQCIVATGAQPLLYMTWGHRDGDPGNVPHDTYRAMQSRLRVGYEGIARPLRIRVSPAGLAWELALRRQPGLELWSGDGSHPTVAGTYLAACVMYQTMFGRSPVGNRFTAGLDPATSFLLQQTANETVTNYPYARL